MNTYKVPAVLSIAGFDGSGGAGIQADTKTISALGCYAMNVLTALPVQNTRGVRKIYSIPTQAVQDQLETIFEDIYPDAVKIGMVHSVELAQCISQFLASYAGPVVFDPVMVSTSGDPLIQDRTMEAIIEHLFPLSTLITPNLDEISILVNQQVDNVDKMQSAANKLIRKGVRSVLVKGGHLKGSVLSSLLLQQGKDTVRFDYERIDTRNTHGSGCTLSSAIAGYLALGNPLEEATRLAQDYVHQAVVAASDLHIGEGSGPLNHFFDPQKLKKFALE